MSKDVVLVLSTVCDLVTALVSSATALLSSGSFSTGPKRQSAARRELAARTQHKGAQGLEQVWAGLEVVVILLDPVLHHV